MHRLRINKFFYLKAKRISVISLTLFLSSLLSSPVLAAYSWTETSQADFNNGVFTSATSSIEGVLELSREKITLPLDGSFKAGRVTVPDSLSVTSASDAAVTLGQSQTYTSLSPVSIGGNAVHSFLATATDVLYVSTAGYGLTAIDTQGTPDPSDDVKLIDYTTTSSPAIVSNTVLSSFVDSVTGYLFVNTGDGTDNGISVIDPLTSATGTLIINYNNTNVLDTVPNSSFLDRSSGSVWLYVSTNDQGVMVIDISTTTEPILVKNFAMATTTAADTDGLLSNTVRESFLDISGTSTLLYAATDGGLSVFSLGADQVPSADDSLLASYNLIDEIAPLKSNINLISTNVFGTFLDKSTGANLLFVSTEEGVMIINIGDPASSTDDILVENFTTADNPTVVLNPSNINLPDLKSSNSFFDASSKILYISNGGYSDPGGLLAVDLNEISSSTDDVLVYLYDTASRPSLASNLANHSFLDADKNIYVSAEGGLSIIHPGSYNKTGDYYSQPLYLSSTTPQTSLAANTTTGASMTVDLAARFGDASVFWLDDFDDNNPAEIEVIGYAANFNNTAESNGILSLKSTSIPADNATLSFDIDAGNLFATGSVITIKARHPQAGSAAPVTISANKKNPVSASVPAPVLLSNEWSYFTYAVPEVFSNQKLKVDITVGVGWATSTDSIEIDWISVEDPNSGAWTAWYAGSDIGSIRTATSTRLQYRATLENSGAVFSATPVLNSVDLYADFPSATSTYVSRIFDASSTKHWLSLEASVTNTASTTTAFYTRSGNSSEINGQWSAWWIATSSIPSPDSRYIQYKIELKSDNIYETPQVASVTVNYEDAPVSVPAPTTSSSGGSSGSSASSVLAPVATTTLATTTAGVEKNNSTQTGASADKTSSAGVVKGEKILSALQENILSDAKIIFSGDLNSLLASVGKKRNLTSEMDNFIKFLKPILKQETKLTDESMAAVLNFIVYGTPSAKYLNAGERAGVINAHREAFGASPKNENEWVDILRAANGQAPIATSSKAEEKAAKVFKKIYKRASSKLDANDSLAVKIAAYGIHTRLRDLKAEIAAIAKFRKVYGYKPAASSAWNTVRAVAYSGVKK